MWALGPDETKPKYQDQREQINQMRAECVQARLNLKSFLGGLAHNDYTEALSGLSDQ